MSRGHTYIAFDYGTRKIGVAIGQDLTRSARELDTVSATSRGPDWGHIEKLLSEWRPTAAVVGLPLSTGRDGSAMERRCRSFGDTLSQRYQLSVHFVDETLSSESATRELAERPVTQVRRRRLRDQTAARLILETFFDHPGAVQ